MKEILPGIEILGPTLWIKEDKVLVISDLHIGYEEHLQEKGVLVPRDQLEEIKDILKEVLDKVTPKLIVINGDLKHEFGKISKQEWSDTFELLDFLRDESEVILIKGNHDTILEPIAKKKKIEIKNYYCTGKICVLHGHNKISNEELGNSEVLVIGHDHPAISLKEGIKKETYKCFLVGKYKGKKLVVMPSIFPLIEGADIKREKLMSPYLPKNLGKFEVYIIGDKEYYFGKVGNIK